MNCKVTEFPSQLALGGIQPISYMGSCEKVWQPQSTEKAGKLGGPGYRISGSQNSSTLLYLNPSHCSFEKIFAGKRGVCRAVPAHPATLSEL